MKVFLNLLIQALPSPFPQGGVISPLLSNIALDGLEKRLVDWAKAQPLLRSNGRPITPKGERRKSISFVRYADAFVVMSHNLDVIKKCKEIISEFLVERGLGLSDAKTKLVHIRILFENSKLGFEFPSFKIKHFDIKT